MKKAFLYLILIAGISCSSDDTSNNNGFTFDNKNYQSKYAWIHDKNIINSEPGNISFDFTNLYINSNNTSIIRNTVHFVIKTETPVEGTYEIFDYKIANEVVYDEYNLVESETIFIHKDATAPQYQATGTLTIHRIKDKQVDLSYTFTRADGKILAGHYKGSYIIPFEGN